MYISIIPAQKHPIFFGENLFQANIFIVYRSESLSIQCMLKKQRCGNLNGVRCENTPVHLPRLLEYHRKGLQSGIVVIKTFCLRLVNTGCFSRIIAFCFSSWYTLQLEIFSRGLSLPMLPNGKLKLPRVMTFSDYSLVMLHRYSPGNECTSYRFRLTNFHCPFKTTQVKTELCSSYFRI